jgi:hypothetical protein
VTVSYTTADGTAIAGTDYLPASGTLTFGPGMTARTVAVMITRDTVAEGDETFFLDLGPATSAEIADGHGQGTIQDVATFSKADITSPVPGTRLSSSTVTFVWGGGTGVSAYWLTVEDAPGQTIYSEYQGTALSQTVSGLPTDGRMLLVRLWSLLGANWDFSDYSYLAALGPVTTLSINDVSVREGNVGRTAVMFTVTLSRLSADPVTVAYATFDGTATAGSDYTPAEGTLTFAPGQLTRRLVVAVTGDKVIEPNETFFVVLSNPTGAAIADDRGEGVIVNDDPSSRDLHREQRLLLGTQEAK